MEIKHTEDQYRDLDQDWYRRGAEISTLKERVNNWQIIAFLLVGVIVAILSSSPSDYEDKPDCEPTAYHPC